MYAPVTLRYTDVFRASAVADEATVDITSVDKLYLAVLFLIPGFVCMKTYSIFNGERLDASKALVDALAYSCLIYAAFSWAIYWVQTIGRYQLPLFCYVVFWTAILFLVPAGGAVSWFFLRRTRWMASLLPHPLGKAWDYVFSRREPSYVIITLTSGKRVGGAYGGDSFASSYPYDEQIYVEEVWDLDEEQGFSQRHVRSRGMLISANNIESIEFIGLYDDGQDQRQQTKDANERRLSTAEQGVSTEQSGGRLPTTEGQSATAPAAEGQ
ncbi:DUF6338 family protein [Burkholderia seminalis]|uniref:DUF6338 family protein n=1 Tax=Burkholderia seminalis TaxID=488731 RepID=UPI00240A6379|nr:DUF6338 family protein [Burkholderia seminalis]